MQLYTAALYALASFPGLSRGLNEGTFYIIYFPYADALSLLSSHVLFPIVRSRSPTMLSIHLVIILTSRGGVEGDLWSQVSVTLSLPSYGHHVTRVVAVGQESSGNVALSATRCGPALMVELRSLLHQFSIPCECLDPYTQ